MENKVQLGQEVYKVTRSTRTGRTRTATITKVGRKWAHLDGGAKFLIAAAEERGQAECYGPTETEKTKEYTYYDIWLSRADYEENQERKKLEQKLRKDFSGSIWDARSSRVVHLSLDQLKQIDSILEAAAEDK